MSAAQQDDQVLVEIRRRLVTAGIAVLVVLAVGVAGYMVIARGPHRFLDSLYMTVITLTTVGYGETIPLDAHPWGRVFTMLLLLSGMGVLVYFASAVTAFLVEGQLGQVFWRKRMRQAIAALREHYIVCGAGTVAGHVLEELVRVQRPVVAVIPTGATPPTLEVGGELLYLQGDPADEEVLRDAGLLDSQPFLAVTPPVASNAAGIFSRGARVEVESGAISELAVILPPYFVQATLSKV